MREAQVSRPIRSAPDQSQREARLCSQDSRGADAVGQRRHAKGRTALYALVRRAHPVPAETRPARSARPVRPAGHESHERGLRRVHQADVLGAGDRLHGRRAPGVGGQGVRTRRGIHPSRRPAGVVPRRCRPAVEGRPRRAADVRLAPLPRVRGQGGPPRAQGGRCEPGQLHPHRDLRAEARGRRRPPGPGGARGPREGARRDEGGCARAAAGRAQGQGSRGARPSGLGRRDARRRACPTAAIGCPEGPGGRRPRDGGGRARHDSGQLRCRRPRRRARRPGADRARRGSPGPPRAGAGPRRRAAGLRASRRPGARRVGEGNRGARAHRRPGARTAHRGPPGQAARRPLTHRGDAPGDRRRASRRGPARGAAGQGPEGSRGRGPRARDGR